MYTCILTVYEYCENARVTGYCTKDLKIVTFGTYVWKWPDLITFLR